MSYSVYSDVMPESLIKNASDARKMESFFRGMQIDYTLVYKNGNEMEVKFKPIDMNSLSELKTKIARTEKQLAYLQTNKNISKKDKTDLANYYSNKINSYKNREKEIINSIEVDAETIKIVNDCNK